MNGSFNGFISVLLYVLTPLSFLYLIVLKVRRWLYSVKLFKKWTLPARVISVGNITLGGTGKTPHVLYIVEQLRRRNPVVLTRGYGRKNKRKMLYAEDHMDPAKIGDEPFFLASKLKGVPVVISKDRYRAAVLAMKRYGSETFILDDGFQRRYSLHRDLDIVIIDSLKPFGNGLLFPAGTLREPKSVLKDADVIILSKSDEADTSGIKDEIKSINPKALLAESVYEPEGLFGVTRQTEKLELKDLKGKKIVALSAVGSPEYFEKILFRPKPLALLPLRFPDHHYYTREDLWAINRLSSGYDCIITTEKDAVKLQINDLSGLKCPVYSLRIGVKITRGEEHLLERLRGK